SCSRPGPWPEAPGQKGTGPPVASRRRCGEARWSSWHPPVVRLLDDEPDVALQASDRQLPALAVDPVEVTQEVRLEVGGRREAVVRPRQLLAGGGTNHVGRDDDDELGLLLDEIAAAEQRANHRHVLEAGEAVDVLPGGVGDEAGERQRATGGQLDGGLGPARLERGDGYARQDDGAFGGELAHFALDLEADAPLAHHHGREGEADAELLVGDGQPAVAVDHRDRILAAGEEVGGLARYGGEVGLGQRAQQAVALEGAQRAGDLGVAGAERAGDAGVAERAAGTAVVVAEHARGAARGTDGGIERAGAEAGNGQRAEAGGGGERQRVLGEQGRGEVAGGDGGTQVDAELLEDRALHLGHGDLQHHLLLTLDGEQVDHELGVAAAGRSLILGPRLVLATGRRVLARHHRIGRIGAAASPQRRSDVLVRGDELAGDVGGALAVERRAYRAAQHGGPAGHLGVDVGAGDEFLQDAVESVEVGADAD